MQVLEVRQGSLPLILTFPHTGFFLPDDIAVRLNDNGKTLADADWHVEELYGGLVENVTTVRALFHRYAIDANRDPAGASLYPGQNTTGLVPLTDFDGSPIWHEEPSAQDIAACVDGFHKPYHAAIAAEIARLKADHGNVVVFDCHSIRSHIPFLFDGTLPDFNIGTFDGRSCSIELQRAVEDVAKRASGYSHVVNGRFKGGWTTRHCGQPSIGVHAIQMELAQSAYLKSEHVPFALDDEKARTLRPYLRDMLLSILSTLAGPAP